MSIKLKYLHRGIAIISKVIILAFAIAVVLMAILTSLLKYYAPLIENYRPQILEKINSSNDIFTVSVGRIHSHWEPLQPQLILENIKVVVKGQDEVIYLNRLQIDMDLFLSLYYRTVYIERLEIDKLSLKIKQSKAGLWGLRRTAKRAATSPLSEIKGMVSRLWNIESLVLNQLDVSLEAYGMVAQKLPSVNIAFSGPIFAKQAVITFIDQGELKSKLLMNSQGIPFEDGFSMEGYNQLVDVDVLYYLPFLKNQFGLQSLNMKGETWINYDDQTLTVSGHSKINHAHWHQRKSSTKIDSPVALLFDQLTTSYDLRLTHNAVDLWIDSIDLRYKESRVVTQPWHLTLQQPKDKNAPVFLHVKTPKLELQPIFEFVLQQELPQQLQEAFQTLAISGSLEALTLKLPLQFDKTQTSFFELVQLNAKVNKISTEAYKGSPGLKNVSGLAFSNILSGRLYANVEKLELLFKELFSEPMIFDTMKGLIEWNIVPDEKRFWLSGTKLSVFTTGMGHGRGEFYLDIPLKKHVGEHGRLSLAIGIRDNDIKYKDWFIPQTLDKKILNWMDDNVLALHVNKGAYIFHGPITKEALEVKNNQLWLDFDQGEITYLKDWPAIEEIRGEFVLDNNNVSVYIDSADLSGMNLHNTELVIDRPADQAQINVIGRFSGKVKHALNFLQSKGLHALLNNQLKYISARQGVVDGGLVMTIPLGSKDDLQKSHKLKLDVDVNIQHASVYSSRLDLAFEELSSNMNFSLDGGLYSDDLALNVLGSPVKASITSEVVNDQHKTTLTFMTKLSQQQLQQRFKQPIFEFLSGQIDIHGSLVFAKEGGFLQLESTLKGMAIELPSPFRKTAELERSFNLRLPLSDDSSVLSMNYGQDVNVQMRLKGNNLDAMLIHLGADNREFISNNIIVAGQITEANVGQWIEFVSQYSESSKRLGGGGDHRWKLSVDRLLVNHLDVFDNTIRNSKISLLDQAVHWYLSIDHEDVSGDLKIFNDDSPWVANIHHLNLDVFSNERSVLNIDAIRPNDHISSGLSDLRLVDFPDMAVTIEHLSYGGMNFGQWQFDVSADDQAMRIDHIIASISEMQIGPIGEEPASLSWALGSHSRSRFIGRISGGDIGSSLNAWGYGQQVNSESVEFSARLNWSGVPSDFEIKKLSGTIDMNLINGNFSDVAASQSSALKIFSLLNVSALLRRLRLDFSDLSKEGLSFDKVRGVITLNEGRVLIDKPIRIKGTASNINISGNIDLLLEQLDLNVGVTLPFVSNIPWLAALAAGLPAAIGVFIISKLFKKQVDKLSSALYKVSGDLNDPQIKFEKIFSNNAK